MFFRAFTFDHSTNHVLRAAAAAMSKDNASKTELLKVELC